MCLRLRTILSKKVADTHSSLKRGNEVIIVVIVLFAALALRLVGIGGGLPYIFHPDENRQILDALGMAERLSPVPEEFSYPALHKYMLLAVNGAYYAVGSLLGWWDGPASFAVKFLTGESRVFLLSRILSAFAGVALAFSIYRTGKMSSTATGIIGLVFSAFMYHLIQHSQWAIADIFLALFCALSLHYTLASVEKPEGVGLLSAFIFAGLATATKPQGLFLLVPILVNRFLVSRDYGGGGIRKAFYGKPFLTGITVFLGIAVMGNLSWVFEFNASYEKFRMLSQVAHLGISSKEPFTPGFLSLAYWFTKEVVKQEGPLGAFMLAGVVYALVRRTRQDLILLSYCAVFFLAMKGWAIRYLHLFVALFPVLALLGANFTAELLKALRVRGAAVALFVAAAIVSPSALDSLEASVTRTEPDTRVVARAWAEEHIPPGSAVAMDWYEFAVPLLSQVPVNLSNPKAREHFAVKVPPEVRKGYSNFITDKPVYRILPVVYSTKAPNWPVGMDAAVIEKASGKEVYRELYSVFNFRSIDELKKEGAEYLIISSYSYTNFLLDNDPEKNEKAIFNYLVKEDLLSFNKQADTYIDDGKFGLLYFLNKRARDFYTPLLKNSAKAEFLKEFGPGANTTGPLIKIYRLL